MRKITTVLAMVILLATPGPAFACACEIDCKPGESYSDDAEMCVPDAVS